MTNHIFTFITARTLTRGVMAKASSMEWRSWNTMWIQRLPVDHDTGLQGLLASEGESNEHLHTPGSIHIVLDPLYPKLYEYNSYTTMTNLSLARKIVSS